MILADSASTSSGVPGIVWSLAIAGLFAWRGHHAAAQAERLNGRSPYGWEPVTWSIICFCTLLLGRLLLAAGASRARNPRSSSDDAVPQWAPPPAQAWPSPPTPAHHAVAAAPVSPAAVPEAAGLPSPVEAPPTLVDEDIAPPASWPAAAPATSAAKAAATTILPQW
jgi:hypothetical protein